MLKKISKHKKMALLNVALSSLVICAIGVSTFAYWSAPNADTNAIFNTNKYNATDDEFDYYAAIPNMFATDGYDYYNLNTIPNDLVCRVTGLAVVRYEALTSTAYIPSYPSVTIGGKKFNDGTNELPVIHILSGITSNGTSIDSGYSKIKSLIIPSTVTYIQSGAFSGCTFNNVSILSDGEAGYLKYNSSEFGSITPEIEENDKNKRDKTLYTISTSDSTNLVTQFSDKRLEYDNLTHKYYSYVYNKGTSNISVDVKEGETVKASVSVPFGSKYKIEYDKTDLTITQYSYKLKYDSTEVDLYLNSNQTGYEEYNFGASDSVFSSSNYSTITVDEYIGSTLNRSSRATFNLKYLKANYSEDNDNFSFKYAPNNIFESIHYYNETVNSELKSVKGQKRIGVEKAYYLNNVTSKLELINGDKIVTISVPYEEKFAKGLYVEAVCGTGLYIDPETQQTKIPMKRENGVYTYSFAQSVIDKDDSADTTTLPTKDDLTFYAGKENVHYPDNYKDTSSAATALNTGYRRIYFSPYTNGSNLTTNSDYNPATDQYRFHWYLVGWYKENTTDTTIEVSYKMSFLDNTRSAWIVDIPEKIERFKFARMEGEKPLDTSNNWSNVTNQSHAMVHNNDGGDYVISATNNNDKDYIYLEFDGWGWNTKYMNITEMTEMTSPTELNSKVAFKNNSYLKLANCKGNDKFVPLKENIFYSGKNITDGKYEFSTYNNEDNTITTIPIPEGTILSANANDIACGYDSSKITIGFAESSEIVTGSKLDKYIGLASGGIKFKLDCMIVPYIKTSTKNGKTDYNWYIEIHSSELEGISSEIVVGDKDTSVNPTIKNTTIGNSGSVNSPDFIPGELSHIYLYDINNKKGSKYFYAYFWNKTTNDDAWVKLKASSDAQKLYACPIDEKVRGINPTNVTFALLNADSGNWSNKYSQTVDLDFSLDQVKTCVNYDNVITGGSSMYLRGETFGWGTDTASLTATYQLNSDDKSQYVVSRYFDNKNWKLYNSSGSRWFGYDDVDDGCKGLVNVSSDGDRNISFKNAGTYTIYFKTAENKIWINEGKTDSINWYEPFTIDVVRNGVVVKNYPLLRGANTMQNDAMQFYGTGLSLKANDVLVFKIHGNAFTCWTDENETNIVKIVTSTKTLVAKKDVDDVTVFLKGYDTGGFNSWFQDAKSPILKISETTLLVRNTANTAYEEYIALGVAAGDYVVSPYFTHVPTDYFGNGSNLHYYGDLADSENNLGYHTVGTAGSVFTFVPNSINGTEEYIEVYDNNDRYLTTLHYSESESLSTGIHTFDGLFPYVPGEYTNIKLYYNDGKNKTFIYGGANTLEPSYLSQSLSSKISYPFDYYLDEISPDKAFVYDNGAYYMDSVKFDTANTKHQIKYIDAAGNVKSLTVNNSPYAYDKYQLNGFYLFTHESNDKEFAVSNSGSYDLMVYLIDAENCYVGHRTHVATPNKLILRIIDTSDNIAAEYTMSSTDSKTLYRYDAFIKSGYKAEVVNENGVVYNVVTINDYDSYYRIFYSERTNESYPVKIDTIALHFTPGGLNKYRPIYNTSEITYRYNPEPFRLRLSDTTITSLNPTGDGCSVRNMTFDPDTNTYCWEAIASKNGATITVTAGKTHTFKETGVYKLTYNAVEGIKASKLQKADTYYVSLDNQVIAKLDVTKPDGQTADFYEYKVDTVIFNENVSLLARTNTLQVVDANGYQVCDINKVTIGTERESKTEIPAGAYTLNYSVDSARRNDGYLVFTYFKLTSKTLSDCTYTVTLMNKDGTESKTQYVDKVNGSKLLPFLSLNFTLGANERFLGWTKTQGSNTIDYKDQAVVKEQVTLYPVIKEAYKVVFLNEITFDSMNPEVQISITDVKEIKSVTYGGTNYLGTSYIKASENIITINNELFELIGYVTGGQVYTVTFTSEDGSEGSTTFTIEYPNFGEAI